MDFRFVRVAVHDFDVGGPLLIFHEFTLLPVDKILELRSPELLAANSQNEADSIHHIGFASPVRPDDSSESFKRPDCVCPIIRFEIGDR